MPTLLITAPECLEHLTGAQNPETPARLENLLAALAAPEFALLKRLAAPKATRDDLLLAHTANYLDKVEALIPPSGLWALDDDTIVSAQSGVAGLHAVGAGLLALAEVMAGRVSNVFCAVRPPGHHAKPNSSAGFCIYNNVAITALAAQKYYGLQRVAVVDFDVHHGDGTQEIFWHHPDLYLASIHQSPLYPYSGSAEEIGATGNILNLPLPAQTNSATWRAALRERIAPWLTQVQPELLLVSAGYDGHHQDPLAEFNLTADDYTWATELLAEFARQQCQSRLIMWLEGGYDVGALAESVAASVRVLMKFGES